MNRIPNVIHYCWFGNGHMSEKEKKCIESWKKYLPEYSIKRWDETNWDISCCDYVREAYDAKQWAFVSDYARFDILYRFGGLYFDTDVELIRPIDDIIARGPFMGCENDYSEKPTTTTLQKNGLTVAPGLGLAATPGLAVYGEILDSFAASHFVMSDGSLDRTTIVTRSTQVLLKHGLKNESGIQQICGIWIYPSEYFNPKDFLTGQVYITENTRSIHHFNMSWLTPLEQERHDIMAKMLKKGLSLRSAEILSTLLATVKMRDLTFVKEKMSR